MRLFPFIIVALAASGCISAADRQEYRDLMCEYECEYLTACGDPDSLCEYCGEIPVGIEPGCVEAEMDLIACAMTLQCEPYGRDRGCAEETVAFERQCDYELDEPVPISHGAIGLRESLYRDGELSGPPAQHFGDATAMVRAWGGSWYTVWFVFRSDATGTFDLGQPPNDRAATCEQCVIVVERYPGRTYFASAGEITIGDTSKLVAGDDVTLSLSGVELVEYNWHADRPVHYPSTLQLFDVTLSLESAAEE